MAVLNEFELHPDRLATTDEKGRRIYIYPADVKGRFRKWRTRLQAGLILFFLALPWLRLHGHQALLLDIVQRRFEIFGLSLRAHNAPLLIFVFGAAAFTLFFATSLFGRVWCGWACPQTVFIDGVFRRIERWIEGPAFERRRRASGPWTVRRFGLRAATWTCYLAVSLVITHSFLAYFVGTDRLAEMVQRSPTESWGTFLFMAFVSALILFDFAWFREQFCVIVCPYGRFQSVLMDRRSMIVAYDSPRGEPRATPQAKVLAKTHGGSLGDCVNCYRCVQVCPTGIDIRRGLQMECIACTSCIDACDDVMTKLKKPTGLIRYDSKTKSRKQSRWSVRSAVYLALAVSMVAGLFISLARLTPVEVQVLRAHDAPYTSQVTQSGVVVTNHLKIELSNQSGQTRQIRFASDTPETQVITAIHPFVLSDGTVTQTDVFIQFPKTLLQNGQRKIHLIVFDASGEEVEQKIEKEVTLVGPFS